MIPSRFDTDESQGVAATRHTGGSMVNKKSTQNPLEIKSKSNEEESDENEDNDEDLE
jgi:hypothetical protein